MQYAYLIAAGTMVLGLVFGFLLTRRYSRRYERQGEATSEEILAELKAAYLPRRLVEIRTQVEYLPFVFECILENVDSGFGEKQVRVLLTRIDAHRPLSVRNALFPIEIGGVRSDLDFEWKRDDLDRIRLQVLAVPKVARALKKHARTIPRALVGR